MPATPRETLALLRERIGGALAGFGCRSRPRGGLAEEAAGPDGIYVPVELTERQCRLLLITLDRTLETL